MKRIIFLATTFLMATLAHAQWNTSGSNIYNSNSGNVGVGTSSPADQLEIITGNRKVGINTTISSTSPGGIISFSRPDDAGKIMFIGGAASPNDDAVIYSAGGNSELRFVAASGNTDGFGFYTNQTLQSSFASTRPSPVVKITGSGYMGLGTSSPTSRLHINGLGSINVDLICTGRISTGDASGAGGVWLNSANTMFVGQSSVNSLGFYNNGSWRMVVDNSGNVGIGTTSPNQKLTVNGTIYGKEVKVDLSVPGPDYVFEDSYALPSLEDVKSYIDENKHLPEVPSAREMEKNGINLSEMNMLLLKKVEELTLYVIELKTEVNELKNSKR